MLASLERPLSGYSKLAVAVAAYWLVLILLSFRVVSLPAAVLASVVAIGMPGLIAISIVMWRQVSANLRDLTFADDLTGLTNRRAFQGRARSLLQGAKTGSLAIVLLHVDGLKAINDTCGRPTGDELLHLIAGQLRDTGATDGAIHRVGGDEFAIIIDRTEGQSVLAVVGQCQPLVARFSACGHEHAVNLSYGFASNLPGEPFEAVFARAGARLREFKRQQYDSGALTDRRTAVTALPTDFHQADPPPNIASLQAHRSRLGG